MTSLQSTLGEGDIADELAATQRQISIAEFFEKNKHMLGFDSGARALVTAVKEACDNSLTWSTPMVYRHEGQTHHAPIGEVIDDLIEGNRGDVVTKRGGDLEKLPVSDFEALSFNNQHEIDFRRVSSVFRHRVNSDIFRITVEGGRQVELTDYHSVFVLRKGRVVSVETSDITKDDYVVLPDGEWESDPIGSIDLLDEVLDLPSEETERIGLYDVGSLIDEYYDEIRSLVKAQYRMNDFRKCDRLPLNIVRELDLDKEEYSSCQLGIRLGHHKIPTILPITEGLAEFLGLYIAEGCVPGSDHEKVFLSFGSHETELIEYTKDLIESIFGIPASSISAHETATNVTIPSKLMGLVIEKIFKPGDGAREKRIPRFVFDFSRKNKERFLLGYMAGDGHPTKSIIPQLRDDGTIEDIDEYVLTLATASSRLASGLRYLLNSIGYDSTYELSPGETRTIYGKTTEFNDSHIIYVRPDQASTSIKHLPAEDIAETITDPKLSYNLRNRQTRVAKDNALKLADGGSLEFLPGGRRMVEGDLTALPVTDVEQIDYDGEWVYDVSVPGHENFMAGTAPLACHNSLDATEEAGFLPDIYIEISEKGDYYNLVVEDNGPGITKEQLPKVFGKLLYGSRFHRREQSLTPDQQLLVRRDGEIELLPIGVLCDAYLPTDGGATARIPDDIEVPSFNRETHELTWQPVTHAIRHETDEQTYEITTDKGRSVTVTGNHSLFSLTEAGETKEVKAGELEPGDPILTPRRLPEFEETKTEINLLNHISLDQLEDRRLYVYGFTEETLKAIESGESIRKKPNAESPRERYYYRYNGVDILKESLNQYIEKGYLPAETVLNLGWEEKAADCELVTYQVGGKETKIPVTLPITTSLMELVAHYISEGHAGDRQIGFTFGSHEPELIEATERAVASVGGSTTTVTRDRNATRVKAFGSPLAMVLTNWCGDSASNKRVPSFVFESTPELQQHFIAALYQGDGSDAHPSNELEHVTVSETLARQLSVLWNMQGVLASTHEVESPHGYAEGTSTVYRTKVYGEDVNVGEIFKEKRPTSAQQYKRVPTSLLENVHVSDVKYQSVPDTIPGLLAGAGVGSTFEHAAEYQEVIEDALAGEYVMKPRYVFNLIEKGLLDRDHQPTDRLRFLWDTIQNLHGITETDMCLLRVKDVEETEPPEYVYDISVPGATGHDENFVVVNDGALSVKNSRGQQGIGISAAVLYSQLTSGTPAKITSKTPSQDTANYFELIIDTDENEPEIQVDETTRWERPHGTRIELTLEANMRARTQLHNYIRQTAVVNPHARIELKEPDAHLKSDRATDQLPKETEEIRPHPHGVELGTVIKMLGATDSYSLSGFLQEEFTRVGKKTADDIADGFRDHFYGREMAYRPPSPGTEPDLEAEIRGAVSNKGKQATKAFADRVVNGDDGIRGIREHERITHHELAALIETAADRTEAESGTTFGRTVREKARKAAWRGITADLVPTFYTLVDDATTSRKDDATVERMAERLASRFESIDDERHRLTEDSLRSYVDWAADRVEGETDEAFGETSRENVIEEIWSAMRTVPDDPPKTKDLANDRDAAAALLSGMRDVDVMAPPTDCLSPITDELILEGLKKEFDADFYAAETRDAEVHGGDPFIVEAGIAYGGELEEEGSADLLRFANRVPLVYQQGACAITDVVRDIGWRNYGLDQPGGSGIPQGPAVIMVHVASTNVPFTSESKDALANIPAIEHEVELAIRGAARDLKSFLNKRRSLEKRRQKQDVIARILPQMAEKLASVTEREALDIDDSLARIMNNVLVERVVEDGSVKVVVENHSETRADIEVTEIVSVQPNVRDGASVVDMDGEWFIKWSPRVDSGDEAVLEYDLDLDLDGDGAKGAEEATFDIQVDGLEDAKLTVNA